MLTLTMESNTVVDDNINIISRNDNPELDRHMNSGNINLNQSYVLPETELLYHVENTEQLKSSQGSADAVTIEVIHIEDEPNSNSVLPKSCIDETEPCIISLEKEDIPEADKLVEYDSVYDFSRIPVQITGAWKEFSDSKRNNFTKGCKWAPDGSCILTCSDDNNLRIFNLPPQVWDTSQWSEIEEMEAVVKISEGELIYDYSWYPLMNSTDPCSCCFISSSRGSTVHLRDGFTGELRCSYRTYNHLDEIVAPHSVCFDSCGERVFCGFEKYVRVFNVDTPGRNCEERKIYAKGDGQSGIVSCFAFTPMNPNVSVVGSYQKSIGIYSEPSGNLEHLLEGQKGGVTHMQFSPDGTLLYSGGRKDPEILCWDLRNLGTILYSLRRCCLTNQRMYFDISRCGRYVVSGNHNGIITIWDVTKEPHVLDISNFDVLEPTQFYMAHDDCINGISLHPSQPLLCSSSGQRQVIQPMSDDEEDNLVPRVYKKDNSLRLWWVGKWS